MFSMKRSERLIYLAQGDQLSTELRPGGTSRHCAQCCIACAIVGEALIDRDRRRHQRARKSQWQYQKSTAEYAVRKLKGVKSVTILIIVKPSVEPSELKRGIQDAFKRNAEVDANRIAVEANGSEVVLKGSARSWIERKEAERVAWSAPGVTMVGDRIVVSPAPSFAALHVDAAISAHSSSRTSVGG